MGLFFLHDDPFFDKEKEIKKIMDKLDKKTSVEQVVSVEKDQKEVKIIEGDNIGNIFVEDEWEKELEKFDNKVNKMVRSSLGRDRTKSYNPVYDALEKKIVQPEVGRIYTAHQLKSFGIQIQRPTNHITRGDIPRFDEPEKKVEQVLTKKENGFITWWKAWMKQIKENK